MWDLLRINGDATDELRRLAEHFGIPVTTTLMGIGAVDTTEPLSLHMLGMHGLASANYAVEDCDFLIAVGARFDERDSARRYVSLFREVTRRGWPRRPASRPRDR